MMCTWVQNRIPAYLSGELPSSQLKWVRWHISQCHVCQKALRLLKGMQATVTAALRTDIQAPASLTDRVMAAIEELPPADPKPPPRRWFWRRPRP